MPEERKYRCQNRLLQAIRELDNVDCKHSGDSPLNDFLVFERHFHEWDDQAILLTEMGTGKDYVAVCSIGVYTSIGVFARVLKGILTPDTEMPKKDVMAYMIGNELSIGVETQIGRYDYKASFIEVDQSHSDKYKDFWKIKTDLPEEGKTFLVAGPEVVPLINSLTELLCDPELEASVNYPGEYGIKVAREDDRFRLSRKEAPTPDEMRAVNPADSEKGDISDD